MQNSHLLDMFREGICRFFNPPTVEDGGPLLWLLDPVAEDHDEG